MASNSVVTATVPPPITATMPATVASAPTTETSTTYASVGRVVPLTP